MLSLVCSAVLSQAAVSGFLVVGEQSDGTVTLRATPSSRGAVFAVVDTGPTGLRLTHAGQTTSLPTPHGWSAATSLPIFARHGAWRQVRVPSTNLTGWVHVSEPSPVFEEALAGAWVSLRSAPGLEWQVEKVTAKGVELRSGSACEEPGQKPGHVRRMFIGWAKAFDANGDFTLERLAVDCC